MTPEARAIPWEGVVLTLSCPPELQLGAFVVVVTVISARHATEQPKVRPLTTSAG